jgi:hypothetical protein
MPAASTTKAPLLDAAGKSTKQVTLDGDVFGAEVKPHLVHETVRAELNALRAGTRGAKSRGLVAGGRSKPWRQKGTGRARAGTTRAPHWTGGGVAFPPTMRSFEVKVNRKARRAALRGASGMPGRHARPGRPRPRGAEHETAVALVETWAESAAGVAFRRRRQPRAVVQEPRGVAIVAPSELESRRGLGPRWSRGGAGWFARAGGPAAAPAEKGVREPHRP